MSRDVDLVAAWRAGDPKAGEALFRRHFSAISRFFRSKFSAQVDDLIQQTFVALVEGKDRLRDDENVRRYLFGIAFNVMKAHLRALAREHEFDPASTSIIALDPGPSTMHAAREEQRLLLSALRRIPLEHQVLLELMYWEGLNAAQIARIMDVPHSTMRGRIGRARVSLEKAIEQLAQSPALCASTVGGLERWAREIRELHERS